MQASMCRNALLEFGDAHIAAILQRTEQITAKVQHAHAVGGTNVHGECK